MTAEMSPVELLRAAAANLRDKDASEPVDALFFEMAVPLADCLDGIAKTCADTLDDEPCRVDCWHPVCAVNRGVPAVARVVLGVPDGR